MKIRQAIIFVPLLLATVCRAQPGTLTATIDNPQPLPAFYTYFGSSIAVDGDALLVSAPGAGKVYVFDAATRSLVRTLNNPTGAFGQFGSSMSAGGGLVAIGDNSDRSVCVMNYTTGQVVRTFSDGTVMDYGYTTAVLGDYLAVGCYSNPAIFIYNLKLTDFG